MTNVTFEELDEAPEDTGSYSAAPVILQPGQVMVVRTRRAPCAFSNSVRFGKLKVISVDAAAGSARFSTITNPFCNDRALIPPGED
jgi:hypothetical protein